MANVVAGALVFAQFLGERVSSWLAAFGIGLWALMIVFAPSFTQLQPSRLTAKALGLTV